MGRDKKGALNESSIFFFIRCRRHGKELSCKENIISPKKIMRKQKLYPLFQLFGPAFFHGMKVKRINIADLPNERPIIFASNHAFKEDVMSSILLGDKHAFPICGSLPLYFNTIEGAAQSIYGVILLNRRNKASRGALIDKAVYVLKNGGNILLFPEGVWNRSANKLTLDFWPGIFYIAKKSNALIVPEIHLLVDKVIYCSRLSAFDVSCYDDVEVDIALRDLRTLMNTEIWFLMEKYAHSTREEIIGGCRDMTAAGKQIFIDREKDVGKYYDFPTEYSADYRPKDILKEVDVWKAVANIHPRKDNYLHYLYAKERVYKLEREDYQHCI